MYENNCTILPFLEYGVGLTVYKFLGYTLRLFVWNLYTDAYVSHVHIRITSISFIYGSKYTGKPQLVHNLVTFV